MATLKQRLHRKNSSGGYDTIWLETTSDLVKMSGGSTTLTSKISSMDTAINGKAASSHSHSNYATTTQLNELKTSVSSGKSTIAAAVTDKGVQTAADATFATMATNIRSIPQLDTSDATATAAQILSGYSGYVKGNKITGTMANQGAKTASLNCGGSYTIPAGYHNGSGKISANSLASQTDATATAAQILSGYTAWVKGTKLTGTASSPKVYVYNNTAYTGSALSVSINLSTMGFNGVTDASQVKVYGGMCPPTNSNLNWTCIIDNTVAYICRGNSYSTINCYYQTSPVSKSISSGIISIYVSSDRTNSNSATKVILIFIYE